MSGEVKNPYHSFYLKDLANVNGLKISFLNAVAGITVKCRWIEILDQTTEDSLNSFHDFSTKL